jgi:hypothetical protein
MFYFLQRGWVALLLAALALPLCAAEQNKPKPKLPPELENVYAMALAAPPEFAANALLRLSERVSDPGLLTDVVTMAFSLAAAAHHPLRLEPLPGTEPDTAAASLGNALRLGLDGLSLQSRAVRQMLAINPVRGRELFNQMRRPALSRATCETALRPDVSAYYEALTAVAQTGFTPAERARTEDISFVTGALSRVAFVSELAPAATLVASLSWPRNQFEIAAGVLASRLDSMDVDSRAYLASAKSIDDAIGQVVLKAKSMGSLTEPLAAAYRGFITKHLLAPRCGDLEFTAGRFVQGGVTEIFGEEIRGELPPLSSDETAPESILEGETAVARYWQSEPAQRVFQECMRLRQAPDGTNYNEAARRSREWSRQFGDVLNSMAGWKASDENSEADYFNQKATVYQALLELAPSGDASERVMASFVAFLRNSTLQQRSPVQWYWHARGALDRVRADQPDQAARIVAAFRTSGSIILMLDSMLDDVAPQRLF